MYRLFLVGVVDVFALIACSSASNDDGAQKVATNNEVEETKGNLADTNETEANETEIDGSDADGSEVEINLPAEFFDGQLGEEVISVIWLHNNFPPLLMGL